mmetsp:Transcript_2959/g.7496  ORF Transcript_2959/g.7496 Transcript_2959/m.7496 type:complete len:398 (-) Transcript_2959:954-2147(-)
MYAWRGGGQRAVHRDRSRNDLLLRGRVAPRPRRNLPERARQPDHAFLRRLPARGGREPSRRRRRQEPGGAESHQHCIRRKAPHRTQDQRRHRPGRQEAHAVRHRIRQGGEVRRANLRRRRKGHLQKILSRGNIGNGLEEDEGDRRILLGNARDACGRDGAGVLQRRAEAGHEGRGEDRGIDDRARDQRAHRGGDRVRSRQARQGGEYIGVRPGGRDLRCHLIVDRQRRVRGPGDGGGYAPRGTGLRSAPHELLHIPIQTTIRHRHIPGQTRSAEASKAVRERQANAVQSKLGHCGMRRPGGRQGLLGDDISRQVRGIERRSVQEDGCPRDAGVEGCRDEQGKGGSGHFGGGKYKDPQDSGFAERVLRGEGAEQVDQSGRGGGVRSGRPRRDTKWRRL